MFWKCLSGGADKMEILPVPPRMIMYDRAQLPLVSTGIACSDLRIDVDSLYRVTFQRLMDVYGKSGTILI